MGAIAALLLVHHEAVLRVEGLRTLVDSLHVDIEGIHACSGPASHDGTLLHA